MQAYILNSFARWHHVFYRCQIQVIVSLTNSKLHTEIVTLNEFGQCRQYY